MDLEAYLNDPSPNEDLLCHYTNYSTAIEHILHSGKLRFASLRDSHDPLESEDFSYSAYTWASGSKSVVMNSLNELTMKGIRENEIIKRRIKIACFCVDGNDSSEYPHNKACNRSRMWIQYGKAHTGICLVFNRPSFIDTISGQLSKEDLLFSRRVSYKNKLTELATALSLGQADGTLSEDERLRMHAQHFLFTKLKDFQNEEEYRICFWRRSVTEISEYDSIDLRDGIVGILLGSSFPEAYLPLVKLQAKERQLSIYQVFWLHGTPIWVDIEKQKYLSSPAVGF